MSERENHEAMENAPEAEAPRAGELNSDRSEQPAPPRLGRRDLLQAVVGLASVEAARPALKPQRPTANPHRKAVRQGVGYLERSQVSDGSWQHYPGITALAVMAIASAEGPKHPA